MVSFVYLRNEASRSLFLAPSQIHEAFSVSEAVWLCTQQLLGTIVVADNIEDPGIEQLRGRFLIFCLKPETTLQELLWMLTPGPSAAAS